MVYELAKSPSIFAVFLAELRNKNLHVDAMRFRVNLERMAQVLGYELSKQLKYTEITVTTPLGEANAFQLVEQPVLATILRAGLPMHHGLLSFFDRAESAFVSAYRRHETAEKFDIHVEYLASPKLDGKPLIISDPMLATGSSMFTVYKALLKQGNPSEVHIVAAIAAPEAIEFLKKHLPPTTHYWIGAIDTELTAQSYIVPGLGDAGDIAFGDKH